MMRRAHVGQAIAVHDESGPVVIPPGPCWVLERAAWVALIWAGPEGRQQVELTLRDYNACVKNGGIQFPATQAAGWLPDARSSGLRPAVG